MTNESFKEILNMVVTACNKYLFVDRDLQKKELECATQIYISQMKGSDNNVSVSENTTEQGG